MHINASDRPIRIKPGNIQTSAAIEAWVDRKLAGVFRKYGARMTGVEVHFEDVNGPRRGGDDLRCVMEARVNGREPIAVSAWAGDLYAAIDAAARKLDMAIGKVVDRAEARAHRRFRRAQAHDRVRAVETKSRDAAEADRALDLAGPRDPRGGVIIAGYGPVGRALADSLVRLDIPFTVVDTNPATFRTLTGLGVPVHCGDATDPAVLRAAGIEEAAAIAITIPDGDDAVRACAAARSVAPGVHIAARTTFLSQGLGALRAGANSITVEEIATAEAMATQVTRHLAGGGADGGAEAARAS